MIYLKQNRPVEEAGDTCSCPNCKDFRRRNRTVRFQFDIRNKVATAALKAGESFWIPEEWHRYFETDFKKIQVRYGFNGNLLTKLVSVHEQYGYNWIQESNWYQSEPQLTPIWNLHNREIGAGPIRFSQSFEEWLDANYQQAPNVPAPSEWSIG